MVSKPGTVRGMSAGPHDFPETQRFLDSASGLPPSPKSLAALASAASMGWPDPGRRYASGRAARDLLEQSRDSVARGLGVSRRGVFFADSAECAYWWVLTGFGDQGRLLTSAVEELPLLRTADRLARHGREVANVTVDHGGVVDLDLLHRLAAARPAVAVVQDANREIGVRQPIAEVRDALPAGTPLVVDAHATLGREPVAGDWDALVAGASMWGGPVDVTVVAVRDADRFRPWWPATEGFGGVESARPPVAQLATAALGLERALATGPWQVRALVDRFRDGVLAGLPDVQVVGDQDRRLGYVVMVSVWYVPGGELIDELARRGWAVASGASCTSDTRRPQHVLVAVGAPSHGSLRVSVTPATTAAALDAFTADLIDVVTAIRTESGVADL